MTEEREEMRYRRDVVRRYKGQDVVIKWEPAYCIHAGACFMRLPQTFDPLDRPWVKPETASTDELVETILACPTGALSFEPADASLPPSDSAPATIEPRPNGPLFIRGEVEVVDGRGNVLRRATRLALCRCGHSYNKPYCDLSHRAYGFTDR